MSAPIECYKFETSMGDVRLTSYHEEVVLDSEVYVPTQITRTAIEISSSLTTIMTVDIIIDNDHQLALDCAYGKSPQKFTVHVLLTEEGSSDFTTEWVGDLVSVTTNNSKTTFKTGSIIQSEISGEMTPVMYQGTCNHQLYDERCGALREDHTVSAIVTDVKGRLITVDDDVYQDEAFISGTILNLRNGEARAIITNTDNVIEITYPFLDIVEGDEVELSQGCDYARLGSCKSVFGRTASYGGFDWVPLNNPFDTGKV